jgi:hypothetical protein
VSGAFAHDPRWRATQRLSSGGLKRSMSWAPVTVW